MTVDVVTTFFALLSVLCLVFVAGVAVVALVAKLSGGLPESLAPLRDGVQVASLPLAFAVAATATLGSLYLSGVAKFAPCELCWFQRYCMYPLAVLLLFAWLHRSVRWWHWTLATVGLGISTYHYLLERFPSSLTCPSNGVSCSAVLLWKFHFLSIPGMAWTGFLTILVLLAVDRAGVRRSASSLSTAPTTQEFVA